MQALGLRTTEVVQGKIGADVNVVGTVLLNDRDVSIVQARTAGFRRACLRTGCGRRDRSRGTAA